MVVTTMYNISKNSVAQINSRVILLVTKIITLLLISYENNKNYDSFLKQKLDLSARNYSKLKRVKFSRIHFLSLKAVSFLELTPLPSKSLL